MSLLARIFKSESPNGHKPRKPHQHSPHFVYTWQSVPDSVAEEYAAGETLLRLAAKYHRNPDEIRNKIVSLGGKIRKKGYTAEGKPLRAPKLTEEQIKWLLEQDDQNVSHADIGRQLDISRERVRQICVAANHKTRRERQTKMLALQEATETRKRERLAFVQHVSAAWKAGASFKEIGALTNAKNDVAAASRISELRKRYGAELFPYRMRSHWNSPFNGESADDRRQRLLNMSKAWLRGDSMKQMAAEFGYKNANSLYATVLKTRFSRPDLFPSRRTPKDKARLSQLWIEGASATEIAREMGWKDPKSVYGAARRERVKNPLAFPPRK